MNYSIAHYGSWTSPISAEKVAEGAPVINLMLVEGENTYFCELRPKNQGRYTIVRCSREGKCQDITPLDFNVRSAVHEYGGAPFCVKNGIIYALNGSNHALYRIESGKPPQQITEGQKWDDTVHKWIGTRYADLQPVPNGIVAIGEKHQLGKQPDNFLAFIESATGKEKILASGHDFYSSPALSPDGKKIAWICWNHPEMPWTSTELWTADFRETSILQNQRKISANFPEAVMQPKWAPDHSLYFISDRDKGWWNLHRFYEEQIENICPIEAEVGDPAWVFGKSSYAFLESPKATQIIFAYNREGECSLASLDSGSKVWHKISRSCTNIQQLRSGKQCVQFLESYADKEPALIQLEAQLIQAAEKEEEKQQSESGTLLLQSGMAEMEDERELPAKPAPAQLRSAYQFKTVRAPQPLIGPEYISQPIHYAFPSNGRIAYGYFYPPHNKFFKAPTGERPPLIIMIHGGPTSQARADFSLAKQFWTSRGFALFDINYAGSTGYGRRYRQLLNQKWGIYDVEDCIGGALWLVKQGLVDGHRLFIRGGSAGGYTTLAVLTSSGAFRGAASYYGVADITALAADTHKFESRYMEQLVGKYPQEKQIWEERSPIRAVDKITTPLIIFQGEKDTVVPKNQSIQIYESLKQRKTSVELHLYPDEEHGFRQSANLIDSLNREAVFYLKLMEKPGLT